MKIHTIQNTSFNAKHIKGKRYLSLQAQKNAQNLLWKMNHETEYTENAARTTFTSYILSGISLNKKIKFCDNRMYEAPTNNPREFKCDCSMYIGKNRLDINSTTGEIVGSKKSFFRTWNGLLNKAEYYIGVFLYNFNEPEIVEKNKFGIKGFTEKGLKQVKKYM